MKSPRLVLESMAAFAAELQISVDSYTKPLSATEFVKRLKETCPGYRPGTPEFPVLWRGTRTVESYSTADPTKGERPKTANTVYNLTVDAWADYPQRRKSVICTTSHTYARNYGTHVDLVIPPLGATVGVAPGNDVWSAFSNLKDVVGIRAHALHSSFDALITAIHAKEPSIPTLSSVRSEESLESCLRKAGAFMQQAPEEREAMLAYAGYGPHDYTSGAIFRVADIMRTHGEKTPEFIRQCMAPEKNGFTSFSYGQEAFTPGGSNLFGQECWFSAPAIFVDSNTIHSLAREMPEFSAVLADMERNATQPLPGTPAG